MNKPVLGTPGARNSRWLATPVNRTLVPMRPAK